MLEFGFLECNERNLFDEQAGTFVYMHSIGYLALYICDMIKGNESDVGDVVFETIGN